MNSEDLILENQTLIKFVINKMGIMYNIEECYEAGELGLIKATKTFDENKGCKFTTYAIKCIQYEISNYLQYKSRESRKNDYLKISLDDNIEGDKKDIPIYEIIDSGVNIERDLIKKEKTNLLNTIIAILEPNDRFMLEHYFGLLGKEKMTQKKIAEVLGVKDRYVTYRIKRAMKIIKKIMEDKYEKEN